MAGGLRRQCCTQSLCMVSWARVCTGPRPLPALTPQVIKAQRMLGRASLPDWTHSCLPQAPPTLREAESQSKVPLQRFLLVLCIKLPHKLGNSGPGGFS